MNNDSNNQVNNGVIPPVDNTVVPNPVPPVEPVTPVAPVAPVTPANPAPAAPAPVTPAPTEMPAIEPIGAEPVAPPPVIGESAPTPSEAPKQPAKTSNSKMLFFVIIILVLGGVLAFLLMNNNSSGGSSEPTPETTPVPQNPTPAPVPADAVELENVKISGYQCLDSNCTASIGDSENPEQYTLNVSNVELFKVLDDYVDYINVNISYVENDGKKSIVDYKIFIKATNEDISSAQNEEELRNKIGLFAAGNHTESLTLSEIGSVGAGTEGDEAYSYQNFTFTDAKGNKYEMMLKNPSNDLNLTVGNSYTVTFDVVKDTFDYEYKITSIQ